MKKIFHYLFKCPTFWEFKPHYQCPECGKRYRCYWDGHDCVCGMISLCKDCANSSKHMVHELEVNV